MLMRKKRDGILHAVARARGGVGVRDNKNTANMEPERIPEPETLVLPMSQHIGSRCAPTVKVGDKVAVGQLIGDSDKPMSAPIHASVSGSVIFIGKHKLANGRLAHSITLESDGEMREFEEISPVKVSTGEELIAAVRDSGLVGLGGAGFPTHIKLRAALDEHVDTLIINAAECEPYITVDYRECIDSTKDIIDGIIVMKDLLKFKQVIIAVEDNKPLAIKALKKAVDEIQGRKYNIKVMSLKSRYPQGAEKMMIYGATGRRVSADKLPSDIGCLVMNVTGVAFIARYLSTGKPLVSRSLTVDGSAIMNPKNVRVPVGISVQEVIDFCGGFKSEPYKMIAGGPMMGTALVETAVPILKKDNAILAFSKESIKIKQESSCIRCGRCADVCPMYLAPSLIEDAAKIRDVSRLKALGLSGCMECGCCAYACPAGKPLVQHMRLGKDIVREFESENI